MVVKTKAELKASFQTGDIPTQQDFADTIDSFVGSVNNKKPDENGNVEIQLDVPEELQNDVNNLKTTTGNQGTTLTNVSDKVTTLENTVGTQGTSIADAINRIKALEDKQTPSS